MSSVNLLYSVLKTVDQPNFVRAVGRAAPFILPAAGALFVATDASKHPAEARKKRIMMTGATAFMTIVGALTFRQLGPKLFKKMFHKVAASFDATQAVASVREQLPKVNEQLNGLLERVKTKILHPGQVHRLRKELLAADPENGIKLFKTLIPDAEAHSFKDLIGELGKLSLMGLFPVAGGIIGGIFGSLLTGENVRDKLKAQTAEAFYQFAANIALCNVGAAGALGILEVLGKSNPKFNGRVPRLVGMSAGIALVGVVFGSAIANFFSKNFMNGFFEKGVHQTMTDLKTQVKDHGVKSMFKDLNAERQPGLADMGLHIDDFASVGVLAGLAWLEPLLMTLYSFSGFRAGSGFRSPHDHKKHKEKESHRQSVNEHHKLEAKHAAFDGNPFSAPRLNLPHPPHPIEELHPAAFSSQPTWQYLRSPQVVPQNASFFLNPARTPL